MEGEWGGLTVAVACPRLLLPLTLIAGQLPSLFNRQGLKLRPTDEKGFTLNHCALCSQKQRKGRSAAWYQMLATDGSCRAVVQLLSRV